MLESYLGIEGNIGSGKTTLSKMLSEEWQANLILEQFEDNSFLPKFYKEPERYAFPLEMSFLTSRYSQLRSKLNSRDLFKSKTVADYGLFKSLVFARVTLNEEEFHLYLKFFDIVYNQLPRPEKIVYLHRPVPELMRLIKKRGRSYEQDISADYLAQVQDGYMDYFRHSVKEPVLILEMGSLNFEKDATVYRMVKNEILQEQQEGLKVVSMI